MKHFSRDTAFAFILFGLLFSYQSYSQIAGWQWAHNASGSDSDQGKLIASDDDGNVIVAGTWKDDTINFPLGSFYTGDEQFFVAKYDADGNMIWIRTSEAENNSGYLTGIASDHDGNIYISIVVQFDGLTFAGHEFLNETTSSDYIVKLNPDGEYQFSFHPFSYDAGKLGMISDMDVDGAENIYITGRFTGMYMLDGSFIDGTSGWDTYTMKFDQDGNYEWVQRSTACDQDDWSESVSVTDDGIVTIAGHYGEDPFPAAITFDGITINSAGNCDLFVVQYDTDGNQLWASGFGSDGFDYINGMSTDEDANVYITGTYSNSIIFHEDTLTIAEYKGEMYLARISNDGNAVWGRSAYSMAHLIGVDVACGYDGQIYLYTLMPSPSVDADDLHFTTNSVQAVLIIGYDSDGNALWGSVSNGPSSRGWYGTVPGLTHGAGIAPAADGGAFITGYYMVDQIEFGVDVLIMDGSDDFFIAKAVESPVGIHNEILNDGLSVYPNPNNGIFNVINDDIQMTSVRIFNLTGNMIYTADALTNEMIIDISIFPSGIYFVELNGKMEKVVKL